MEMSEQMIRQGMAATMSDVNAFKFFLLGKYNELEYDTIKESFNTLAKAPLYINDTRMTIEQIISWLAYTIKKHGVKMVAIDYLQLTKMSAGQHALSRNEQVMEWSGAIKEITRKAKVATLLISQLSRTGIKMRDLTPPPPTLEALRDSGAVEQDADCVIFVYKQPEEPWENFVTDWPMIVDVHKHRNGPIGAIKAVFRRDRQKFMAEEDYAMLGHQTKLFNNKS